MPKPYPPELRRKVLDLLASGRRVARVSVDLDISDQTVYAWRHQELIASGQQPGTTGADNAELVAVHRRATELLREGSSAQDGARRSG